MKIKSLFKKEQNLISDKKPINESFKIIWSKYGIFLILLGFGILLSILSDRFFTISNITNVLKQSAVLAIMTFGLLVPVTTGHTDLTVGAFSGLSSALVAGWAIQFGVLPGVLLGFSVSIIWGLITGFIVTRGKGLDVIVTLAMMIICQGFTLLYTNGRPIIGFPDSLRFLASNIGPIPMSVILALIIGTIIHVIFRYTKFGRELFAIGGNIEAARLSGVKTINRIISAFVISAFCSALSGLVRIARVYSAQPTAGVGDEFTAIGAVLIGGASMKGGSGSVWGTLAGVLILGMISNGLNLLQVNPYYQYVIRGLIILFAILMDQWGGREN